MATKTIGITIDLEDGQVKDVGEVVEKIKFKPPTDQGPISGLQLKGITQNPSVIITTKSNPGCITYIVNGRYYRI